MIGTGLTAVYFLLLVNRFGASQQVLNLPPVTGLTVHQLILAALIVILGLAHGWCAGAKPQQQPDAAHDRSNF